MIGTGKNQACNEINTCNKQKKLLANDINAQIFVLNDKK